MKRASISLSANFLVVIIVAIVVLGMGIAIAKDMFSSAEEQINWLDTERKHQLVNLLDTGQMVGFPIQRADLSPGEYEVYPIIVRNVGTNTEDYTLKVESQTVNGCDSSGFIVTIAKETLSLEPTERGIFEVAIEVPKDKPQCIYVFKGTIKDQSGQLYGNPGLLYVHLKR